ncbi:hypothetical protein [Lapidilactobacillus luobeiensis]|uniref:hypothetical protein n=1 Tax=Lapidilactobacillus luobeiensis TaxID=2950371 RepID=UPI0021C4AF19|nr:hypothetical protein [Lapidilactobacillus luobeiensis]
MQNFFDNTMTIQAEAATIGAILLDPSRLIRWNPAIQSIQPIQSNKSSHPNQPTGSTRRYQIGRDREAINQSEELTISQNTDLITYSIQGERLAYRVQFKLIDNGPSTIVAETVMIDTEALPGVPLTLLRPITKHAFLTNLRALAALAEYEPPRVAPNH